jgi:polysaccharide export outer membrane protein
MKTCVGRMNAQWIVIGFATLLAVAGCQSVTTRGQNDAFVPFPEADEPLPPPSGQDSETGELPSPLPQGNGDRPSAPPMPRPQNGDGSAAPRAATEKAAAGPTEPESAGIVGTSMWGAPSELRKTSLPTYVVEPPDILLIDAIKLVPKPPYRIESLDILQIVVVGTLLGQDIAGQFVVDPSGMVDLGPAYGKVFVAGLAISEATEAIDKHLRRILREPEVSVVLAQSSGMQQIAGEHLIGPDGTINLGTYGSVYVAGLTLAQVKDAVEAQLGKYLQDPRISVDVFAYNSKVYYIISQGAGLGDGVTRVPVTGNETVLDAIAQVNGLSRLASKRIWIARPTPGGKGCEQTLPVNWNEITAGAVASTNYQILPGDRVFIAEDKLIATDAFITKITAPFERMLGFTLLGNQTIQQANRYPQGIQGAGNNF